MSNNIIHSKFRAFFFHLLVTLVVAGLAAYWVFTVWFPQPFAEMMGGRELFLLVLICDIILGPLISFIIYNRNKKPLTLFLDYSIVAAIQIGALGYGAATVADLRPAFLVFTVDQYVVVSAGELTARDFEHAQNDDWNGSPWLGHKVVFVKKIDDPDAQFELAMSALSGGRDLQHVVENYRPISAHVEEVVAQGKTIKSLLASFPTKANKIRSAVADSGYPESKLRWLYGRYDRQFWTVLVDVDKGLPVAWLNLEGNE